MNSSESNPTFPFVSVIIPVRNEAQYIRRSLAAVLAQDYPAECMEVLVVDGMSTDGTRQVVEQIAAQSSRLEVRLLENPHKIVPVSLNLALRQAKGAVIVRVDGHCEIAPDYVARCVAWFDDADVDCVGGPIETLGETWIAQGISLAMSSNFGVGGSAFRTGRSQVSFVDTIAFPAYQATTIRQIGLFDEELIRNQDDEYNYRLRECGGKILLDPKIRSKYYSRASLGALWRQYLQYGYWKVRVMQKHPAQMQIRQFIPFTFVTASTIAFSITLTTSWGWVTLVVLAGLYLLAGFLAAGRVAVKNGWRHFMLLPFVFLILHLSYGFGFAAGLIVFFGRWGDRQGKVPDFNA